MRRLVVTTALTGLVLTGCAQRPAETGSTGPESTIASFGVTSPSVPHRKLSPHGRDALEKARRDGARTIGLTVSTEPGKADEVAATVTGLGGTVEATDATIGYVRVTVPVEVAEEVASADGISRVDVDEPLSNIDPTP